MSPHADVPSTDMPAVVLEGISRRVGSGDGRRDILADINLSFPRGSFISVIGPSGSGKTTLMGIIAGLDRPTSGRVQVLGTELGLLDEDQLAAFRGSSIGFVFQDFHLIPTLTALENVQVPLELNGRMRDARQRALESLDGVGLVNVQKSYPAQMSGGEKQRVAIARALTLDPDLILADEPTGNLDRKNSDGIMEILRQIHRDANRTIVLVTHDMTRTTGSDRVLVMDDGRISPLEVPIDTEIEG